MRRSSGQLGFGDLELASRGGRKPGWFTKLDEIVDWAAIDARLACLRAAPTGRPGHPPLMLFKALLLQLWYGLSDEALEEALGDRLSFQRFCGIGIGDPVPDHMAIWRFRRDLAAADLDQALHEEVLRQLDAHGLVLRRGTLVDASFVQGGAAVPAKDTPAEALPDPEARGASKNKRFFYGYKLHVAVDQGSGLVRAAEVTPANVNDCVLGPALVQGDEGALLADQAYGCRRLRERLAACGVADRVMRRANRHHPVLPEAERARNREIGRERAPVERVFAQLKVRLGLRRTRCFGLAANRVVLRLACLVLNLRRACTLLASGVRPPLPA